MKQEFNNNNIKPFPSSVQSQSSAGPQGTRMYETADLERLRSRIVAFQKVDTNRPSLLGISLPFTGRRFPLKAASSTVGRAVDNDIILNDPGVSAIHAKIIQEDGIWRVVNLLSTNGTFVNGKKQTIAPLKPGDRVRFGRAEFVFDYPNKSLVSPKTPPTARKTVSSRLLGYLIAGIALLAMAVLLLFQIHQS